MKAIWNRMTCASIEPRPSDRASAAGRLTRSCAWVLVIAMGSLAMGRADAEPRAVAPAAFHFPTMTANHPRVQALLINALRYVAPESGTVDPISGYPFEGWNQDPAKGLYLRSFTQLTAIGKWMELLSNVAAGAADTPYLSREQALERLLQVARSLRHDQKDREVSAKGLLGNFLDLAGGKRQGPLASDLCRQSLVDAFGPERADALWEALRTKGWIVPDRKNHRATIARSGTYGARFFDGPLAPFADEPTKHKLMALLDQRVVMIVFGDNANLTRSVAKTIGALLTPTVKDREPAGLVRHELEAFLEDQQEGYTYLYDAKVGLFHFGWDATRNRLFGWEDEQGNWQTGHLDYLVNEFRGPATFVVLRYGLPADAIRNLGFKIKPYRLHNGHEVYTLAPWDGSAFQALGLGLAMQELQSPGWRKTLENAVDIEIDYAVRNRLPGFLSECYTGDGQLYTGQVGIPDIAVDNAGRITDAASLYTLGVAYTIAPAKVEQFLEHNWGMVSRLLTDHGPWEGFNVAKQEPIQFQTTAHTLALAVGLLGTSSTSMSRYLEFSGMAPRLAEIHKVGQPANLLGGQQQVYAWAQPGVPIHSKRVGESLHVHAERASQVGIAFVAPDKQSLDLAGGKLTLRYRSAHAIGHALVAFKPVGYDSAPRCLIPKELFTRFRATNGQEAEIQVPLPAMPGLRGIQEVVITCGPDPKNRPLDLTITQFAFTPEKSLAVASE
jgi:hypothetical protein